MTDLRLKELREDGDFTQKEIANLLHVQQNTYSQYENQLRQLPLPLLVKLADFYGTSVDYILERTDERKPYPRKRKTD